MSRNIASKPRSVALAAVLLISACLLLAACGGSSGGSSSSASAAAKTAKAGGPQGAGAKRFTALRECLQKNGITLPTRTPGQKPKSGSGGFLGGAGGGAGPQLPKGVTRAQYQAAIKKCGALAGGRFGAGGAPGGQRINSPAFKAALSKFATCMRQNGVNVPTPNTSGKGPVFNTKGLDTTSAKFKAAQTKCASVLRGVFRTQPGAAPPSAG